MDSSSWNGALLASCSNYASAGRCRKQKKLTYRQALDRLKTLAAKDKPLDLEVDREKEVLREVFFLFNPICLEEESATWLRRAFICVLYSREKRRLCPRGQLTLDSSQTHKFMAIARHADALTVSSTI